MHEINFVFVWTLSGNFSVNVCMKTCVG